MFCSKCGANIPEGATLCPECGNRCEGQTGARIIKLKCKNCNGDLEVDADKGEYTCPYCGDREKILDSDAVAIEKLKSNTYKEMEYARMANEKEKEDRNEKREEQKTYRKSKFSKVTIVSVFICIIAAIGSFSSGSVLSGIIALIQSGLLAVSWLMGMQIIKEKKKFIYVALAVLAFLLVIPFGASHSGGHSSSHENRKLNWPDDGLAAYLPAPDTEYGYVLSNDKDYLSASADKVTDEKYADYIEACKKKGFDKNSSTTSTSFEADNKDGYHLELTHYSSDSMDIYLSSPERMKGKTEITTEASTEEKEESVTSEDATSEEVEETTTVEKSEDTSDEETSVSDSSVVDPDLKAFLDSYEVFIDDYIEFMEKYENSDDTVSMLADYADYASKYADFVSKADAYDADKMSPVDSAYYLEVMTRCNTKLAKATL